MAAQLTSALWPEHISVDHDQSIYQAHTFQQDGYVYKKQPESFLYSARLRKNLEESRKAFLNLSDTPDPLQEEIIIKPKETLQVPIQEKRNPSKKISFKIKKTSSIYRRSATSKSTISVNTVQELTKKYNELVEKNAIIEEPKIRRLVKRVNSQQRRNSDDNKMVVRRPSVKLKPSIDNFKRQGSIKRKVSIKKSDNNKMCVRAKIGYLESPQSIDKIKTRIPQLLTAPMKEHTEGNGGTVKAAIAIFEQKLSNSPEQEFKEFITKNVPKPKVPEKKFDIKDIIIKNQEKRMQIFEKRKSSLKTDLAQTKTNINNEQINRIETENNYNFDEIVEIVNIPLRPPKRCDSNYETMHLKRISPVQTINEVTVEDEKVLQPNTSFLWRLSPPERTPTQENEIILTDSRILQEESDDNWKDLYDTVDPSLSLIEAPKSPSIIPPSPPIPPRPNSLLIPNQIFPKKKMPLPKQTDDAGEDKIYEELTHREKIYETLTHDNNDYEYCESPTDQRNEETDDGYEYCVPPKEPAENIYETLPTPKKIPPLLPRRQEEPLPPRPPSRNSRSSYCTIQNSENVSNCYESIYSTNKKDKDQDTESNYESIYGCHIKLDDWGSPRDSIVSADQQTNSIYGRSITSWAEDVLNTYIGRAASDLSSSDRSDEWVDLSDNDEELKNAGFVIVRERQKLSKKTSGWSQQLRDQWNKSPKKIAIDPGDSDSDHHYESLYSGQAEPQHQETHDDDFDSFDSDSESDNSFAKNDSGVDMGNTQLPEPPNNQTYVLTRLAASAGKHMKRLRRNWSLTKNDITKSLSRMTKRKSRTDLDTIDTKSKDEKQPVTPKLQRPLSLHPDIQLNNSISNITQELKSREPQTPQQNIENTSNSVEYLEHSDKNKSIGRKGFLNKFRRRSLSMTSEAGELGLNVDNKPKSTFYLTDTIDIEESKDEMIPIVNVTVKGKTSPVRPQIPPPPAPTQISPNIEFRKSKETKRSTSWYAECGLFKNSDQISLSKRPNTFWYAEVGLYQSNGTSSSTPSTSSTENSGSTTNVVMKSMPNMDTINQDDSEDYYNMRNENDYYNESIKSFDSCDTKKDEAFNSLSGEMQLRLQDEPLYQFYDAAVLESVCQDGTSEFDYDGYEEVGHKKSAEDARIPVRPSAMELISPSRNNVSVTRTLWCEIPEVIQSSVLSTLSLHQKKVQEAKFEMLTSEASYLNSLNVLVDHFIKDLKNCEFLTYEEKIILFGKVLPVRECSEKLLLDLEKCWQDNILLHGVCEIIKQHAEENFSVYVSYCENQILLDVTLRNLKDRPAFMEYLRQLESSAICQLLTLHSFLMLPMQRITRWPLLVDAVLKRLSPQDDEYISCQYALATLNKIVNQCNEGARKMERITEMQKIASQLEFGKNVPPIPLVTGSRWLVRSGPLTQMQARGDDVKLTFGKRFSKVPLYIFLFNDILVVAKCRGEENYVVLHYCYRSLVEINGETLACLPFKDTQGRHLIFLTILENHEDKTIELLLSCNSETDKERWLEALSPPKSENPDETLYECWDCPQVTAVHGYVANQPDELALARGDIINVTRKMADGWYHGERIRDGETGWFPANYTVEVANPHVRARNLKQRYRLLAFSENYLKTK